jgi:hypothetical protein
MSQVQEFPKVRALLREGVDCIEQNLVVGDDERAKLEADYQEALKELAEQE